LKLGFPTPESAGHRDTKIWYLRKPILLQQLFAATSSTESGISHPTLKVISRNDNHEKII
jgi:hypothetical protein